MTDHDSDEELYMDGYRDGQRSADDDESRAMRGFLNGAMLGAVFWGLVALVWWWLV